MNCPDLLLRSEEPLIPVGLAIKPDAWVSSKNPSQHKTGNVERAQVHCTVWHAEVAEPEKNTAWHLKHTMEGAYITLFSYAALLPRKPCHALHPHNSHADTDVFFLVHRSVSWNIKFDMGELYGRFSLAQLDTIVQTVISVVFQGALGADQHLGCPFW